MEHGDSVESLAQAPPRPSRGVAEPAQTNQRPQQGKLKKLTHQNTKCYSCKVVLPSRGANKALIQRFNVKEWKSVLACQQCLTSKVLELRLRRQRATYLTV